jgi:murein endopeptidase
VRAQQCPVQDENKRDDACNYELDEWRVDERKDSCRRTERNRNNGLVPFMARDPQHDKEAAHR